MSTSKKVANILPPTSSFDWLQRAASKLQKTCYRNAGYKYKKIIKDLKNEIERLTKRGEEIIPSLQDENKRLKIEIQEKEKQCYDLNVMIEDLLIQAEEKSFLLENFGKTTNIESTTPKEPEYKNVKTDKIVDTEKSNDSSEDNEEIEKEAKTKDSDEDEEIDKETRKGNDFDREENIRKVELEMARIKPKKEKQEKEKKRPQSFSPSSSTSESSPLYLNLPTQSPLTNRPNPGRGRKRKRIRKK